MVVADDNSCARFCNSSHDQSELGRHLGAKAGARCRRLVVSGDEIRRAIEPVRIRDDDRGDVRRQVFDRDLRVSHDRTRRVAHGARECCSGYLSEHRAAHA